MRDQGYVDRSGDIVQKRVLVVSDSWVDNDFRVTRQIAWLQRRGHVVDVIGRGPAPAFLSGHYFSMPKRGLPVRVFCYFFTTSKVKYWVLIESTIPEPLRSGRVDLPYDFVILNEIEMLPWFDRVRESLTHYLTQVHLDLHEYSPGQKKGLFYSVFLKAWRDYMISFISKPYIRTRTVVGSGIAQLYEEKFGFARPVVIYNSPPFENLTPKVTNPTNIRLVHHGATASLRRLNLMIEAMSFVPESYSLDLFLVGSSSSIQKLRKQAKHLGDRVTFRDPVPMTEIVSTLSDYDAEVIFFPPETENLKFVMPNKFFEAVQARLAVVIGPSADMAALVTEFENGVVAQGWTAKDLANAISRLNSKSVSTMKEGSSNMANKINGDGEGDRFLDLLGLN